MALDPFQILAIVVLIVFVPATSISGWLCYKLGIGKKWGWLALLVVGLLRIVGSALRLAATEENTGVARAARFIPSIGTVALLLAMLELLDKMRRSLQTIDGLLARAWSILYYLQLATFVLSIVGPSIGNASIIQAAACLVAGIFVIQSGCGLFFFIQRNYLPMVDQRISIITLSLVPFLTVRIIYSVLASFAPVGTAFAGRQPDVRVQALMQYLMEFILYFLYLYAGSLLCQEKKHNESEQKGRELEMDMNHGTNQV